MVNIVKELFWRPEPKEVVEEPKEVVEEAKEVVEKPKEVVEEPKKLTARQRIENRKRSEQNG